MVDSQEQASRVESEFREGASALANGEPVLPKHEIVVVSTAEDEALIRQAVTDMTADANVAGMPSRQLIDLRSR